MAPSAPNLNKTIPGDYTLQFIAAWAVFFAILALINRSRLGHAVIYHLLVLAVLVLLAGQYRRFAQIEEPLTGVLSS